MSDKYYPEVGSRPTEYKSTAVFLVPVPAVLFQKWYQYRGTFFKSIRYFQLFVINHRLKIKLFISLWSGANKFLTPKYNATVRSKEGFKVRLPVMTIEYHVIAKSLHPQFCIICDDDRRKK